MNAFKEYFSFGRFVHATLWHEDKPVWYPLLILEQYLKQIEYLIEVKIPKGVYLSRPETISIGKGTVIEPGVYIQGPCIIGRGCILRSGAYVRDGVICGDHCAIGHGAEIKHSILLDSAAAAHFTYVGDSILGSKTNLGAGVKCANLRFDRREVSISLETGRVKSGLKKMGAIIGDQVQIGCNCVLNPGTLVGRGSVAHPLLNFGGVIPPQSKVVGEAKCKVESASAIESFYVS
ncbi:MAG: UDP-N-acetylglucosamine diphosphorylase [Chlamydiia bacterium]|nr:UDP-N-acetylglucosamine diphosphorylase [Chlamydiia bacterium]